MEIVYSNCNFYGSNIMAGNTADTITGSAGADPQAGELLQLYHAMSGEERARFLLYGYKLIKKACTNK